jgi:hypothetical protein
MHALATKIKQWYKIRKIVKEYQRNLFFYKKARDIQRVFRGFLGRRKAARRALEIKSAKIIQRTFRKYFVRNDRHYAIQRIHKILFGAVRKIQNVVRRIQAVERSKLKLLMEIIRENLRAEKERIVLDELLRLEKLKIKAYLETKPGRLQAYFVKRKLLIKKLQMDENYAKEIIQIQKRQEQIAAGISYNGKKAIDAVDDDHISFVTPEMIATMNEYDEYFDGKVTFEKFLFFLKSCQFFLSRDNIIFIKEKFDPNDLGYVYLSDFLSWFESEEADEFIDNMNSRSLPWERFHWKEKVKNEMKKYICRILDQRSTLLIF